MIAEGNQFGDQAVLTDSHGVARSQSAVVAENRARTHAQGSGAFHDHVVIEHTTFSKFNSRCAPRPVLFSNAEGDPWANPSGQFEMLQAADPVYRFLGVEGLGVKAMPPQRHLADSRLGYYIREGKHSMTADDWRVFLNFADRQWDRSAK